MLFSFITFSIDSNSRQIGIFRSIGVTISHSLKTITAALPCTRSHTCRVPEINTKTPPAHLPRRRCSVVIIRAKWRNCLEKDSAYFIYQPTVTLPDVEPVNEPPSEVFIVTELISSADTESLIVSEAMFRVSVPPLLPSLPQRPVAALTS